MEKDHGIYTSSLTDSMKRNFDTRALELKSRAIQLGTWLDDATHPEPSADKWSLIRTGSEDTAAPACMRAQDLTLDSADANVAVCDPTDRNQLWVMDQMGAVRSAVRRTRCLTAGSDGMVTVDVCDGALSSDLSQQWRRGTDDSLSTKTSDNLCLDGGPGLSPDDPLFVSECAQTSGEAHASQTWQWFKTYEASPRTSAIDVPEDLNYSGQCMRIFGQVGDEVFLDDCARMELTQYWAIDGSGRMIPFVDRSLRLTNGAYFGDEDRAVVKDAAETSRTWEHHPDGTILEAGGTAQLDAGLPAIGLVPLRVSEHGSVVSWQSFGPQAEIPDAARCWR